MSAVELDRSAETDQTVKVQVCDHTLHAFGDQGRMLGSWGAVSGPYGLRVSCKICDRFYGYAPVHSERTPQQLHKVYIEQRNSASIGVG